MPRGDDSPANTAFTIVTDLVVALKLQRAVVGLATAHLEPGGLSVRIFGGDGPQGAKAASILVPETKFVAVCVIIAWLVGWTILGAWRMTTRDA